VLGATIGGVRRFVATAAGLSALVLAGAAIAHDVNWRGTSGHDVRYGHPHRDTFHGRAGNDELYGRGGPDTLFGQRNRDLLSGGYGPDILDGGRGVDSIYGGHGADVVLAQDGNLDVIVCGPGHDIAWVDLAADYWEGGGCEDVRAR
jgi:Ca2+-binding RTX toxin-like protein